MLPNSNFFFLLMGNVYPFTMQPGTNRQHTHTHTQTNEEREGRGGRMKRRSPKYVCYYLVGKLKLEKTLHHCHEVLNDLTGFELYIVLCKFLFSNVTTEYFYLCLTFRMVKVDTSFAVTYAE